MALTFLKPAKSPSAIGQLELKLVSQTFLDTVNTTLPYDVMRPTLYRSRNALFLSAKRYQHNVSATKQKPSGLEGTIHHVKDAIGATTGRTTLHICLRP